MDRSTFSRPLRIAYLGHSAALSGGELAFVHLIGALRERGADIEALVVLAEDGPLVDRLRAVGATTEVLPLDEDARAYKGRHVRGAAPFGALVVTMVHATMLARRLRALGVDAIHTMSLKAALYGGVAGRLARVPVVWSIQDRIAADFIPPMAVRSVRLAARVLPRAIIANSLATAETLRGAGPEPLVIHPVVPALDPVVRQGDPTFTVGLIGRLVPWKGQEVFLRAMARAFPDRPVRARLIGAPLFGEEAFETRLRDLAVELGLEQRVELLGHCDDIARELAQLDVVVHCSTLPEPFGMVVVEAMSAGLPVVAAAAGGPCEIIEPGVNGLLTRPGDVGDLADALIGLERDPALRAALAVAARQRSFAFTGPASADAVRRCYEQLVRRVTP